MVFALLIDIVSLAFQVYIIMLFIRILGSWVPELQSQSWMRFVAAYTDPYLDVFRKIIPPLGMMDLSPIAAFFFLTLLRRFAIYLILLFAQ